jgi:molybdopterin molybdotransferase
LGATVPDVAVRMSVDEGLQLIVSSVRPLASEAVDVVAAFGRLLAEPAIAQADVPRFAASAMDGYALRSGDTAIATADRPVWLPVHQEVRAGAVPLDLAAEAAAAISTGAVVPAGADHVIAREQAQVAAGRLRIERPLEPGRNIRLRGEDFRAGVTVLTAGMRIGAAEIGALVACGVERVVVRRKPRMALIATGNELRGERAPPSSTDIAESNGPMILAAAAELGLSCQHLGCVADEADLLEAGLDRLVQTEADILVSTGGVSGGRYDLVRACLEARGATILFHGLAMRPGKPLLFAIMPDGRPFFGLPGNPVAALVAFRFFIVAAIRRLLQLEPEDGEPVSAADLAKNTATLFLRCRLVRDASGNPHIDAGLDQRSHILSSVIQASHWLRVEPSGDARLFAKSPALA